MITSALLVAAVALCSATSSFGAPIPLTRASDNVQALGRRFPTPYAADSPNLVARHVAPVEDAPVLNRRFPRRIYYKRYAKPDEAKVNVNEVVARSPEPVAAPAPALSLVAREHAAELERRMKKRQLRRSNSNDLYKRTLEKDGVQRRRVDPLAKRNAAPGENPSVKSRAFIPPKDVEERDIVKSIIVNINTGAIDSDVDVNDQEQIDGNTVGSETSSDSGSSSTGPSQSSPSQSSGQQNPSGQPNPSPSSSGTQTTPTTGTQTPPSGSQPGNPYPNIPSSSVGSSSTSAPTPGGGNTQPGTTTSTTTTIEQPSPSQSGSSGSTWTPGQQQQQPPTGQQQPPTPDPSSQQPPANQPPAGSTSSSTSSSSTSTSTSSSTQSPSPTQTSTQNSGNATHKPKRSFNAFEERAHVRDFKRAVPADAFVKRSSTQFKRDV